MEDTRTFQITIPRADMAFCKKLAARMGWELKKMPTKKQKEAERDMELLELLDDMGI